MSDLPTLVASLPSQMGVRCDPFAAADLATVTVVPETCTHGVVRTAVLMMAADMLAGMVEDLEDPAAWHFTTDCAVRSLPVAAPESLQARRTLLRRGTGLSVSEITLTAPDGAVVGWSHITFMRKETVPGQPAQIPITEYIERLRTVTIPPLTMPLVDAAGMVVRDAAAGRVEVALTPQLRQPAGMMQGAVVALIGEYAAQTLAEHTFGGHWVVPDIDIRYLVGGRDGPMYTVAQWIGDPAAGQVRVALHDAGRADRVCTVFLARVHRMRP